MMKQHSEKCLYFFVFDSLSLSQNGFIVSLTPSILVSILAERETCLFQRFIRSSSNLSWQNSILQMITCTGYSVRDVAWYDVFFFSGWHWRNAVKSLGFPTQSYQVFSKTSEKLLCQWTEATEERLGHPAYQCAWKLPRTLPPHACQSEWQFVSFHQIPHIFSWCRMFLVHHKNSVFAAKIPRKTSQPLYFQVLTQAREEGGVENIE